MPQFNISTLVILSIFLTSTVVAKNLMASVFPIYDEENKILIIPRVDTTERAGAYHSVVFYYIEETGHWFLPGAHSHNGDISIDEVTITVTDTFPTKVFLHITGEKFICREITPIDQRLAENIFEIRIHTDITDSAFLGSACKQDREPFVRVIPLSVYGLNAGTYEYNVNDEYHGTFSLLENNQFAEKIHWII